MKTAHDLVEQAKSEITEISIDEAERTIGEADLLLDVREGEEFMAGHIPGAVNIPRGILEFQLSNAAEFNQRDMNIVLYCKASGRAALSARALIEMGYINVQSIEGGFDQWESAGKKIEKPDLPDFS